VLREIEEDDPDEPPFVRWWSGARWVLSERRRGASPRHLLDLRAVRDAAQAEQRARAAIAEHGHSPARDRLLERALARGKLWEALVEWASAYRLTDGAGSSNGWLLAEAVDTLRSWAAMDPTAVVAPPVELRWAPPNARVVGAPTRPAPVFRRRKHKPDPASRLGPLARDFLWLAQYVCEQKRRSAFAAEVKAPTVVRAVQRVAQLIGFTLPPRRCGAGPGRPRRAPAQVQRTARLIGFALTAQRFTASRTHGAAPIRPPSLESFDEGPAPGADAVGTVARETLEEAAARMQVTQSWLRERLSPEELTRFDSPAAKNDARP
jgi:hypothetical protein